jgi:hypothetical protein
MHKHHRCPMDRVVSGWIHVAPTVDESLRKTKASAPR